MRRRCRWPRSQRMRRSRRSRSRRASGRRTSSCWSSRRRLEAESRKKKTRRNTAAGKEGRKRKEERRITLKKTKKQKKNVQSQLKNPWERKTENFVRKTCRIKSTKNKGIASSPSFNLFLHLCAVGLFLLFLFILSRTSLKKWAEYLEGEVETLPPEEFVREKKRRSLNQKMK